MVSDADLKVSCVTTPAEEVPEGTKHVAKDFLFRHFFLSHIL